jgi:hypothetical protein
MRAGATPMDEPTRIDAKCRAYIAFSVSMVLHCESFRDHVGWHQCRATTQSLDGAEKDISVSWSDERKPTAATGDTP